MNELEEYIEELAAFKHTCLLQFKNKLGAVVNIKTRIIDFYKEEDRTYIIIDGGIRIDLKNVIRIDDKMNNYLT